MTYIKQSLINTIILAKLFQLAQTDQADIWDGALVKFFAKRIGKQRVEMALSTAIEKQYATRIVEDGEYLYSITAAGYTLIEDMYLDDKNKIRELVDCDFSVFLSADAGISDGSADSELHVPAADRFVSIGDNMPGYQEVMATIESASETVRSSNVLPAEERSWIHIHVELGLSLLRKGGTVLRSALHSLVVEPLKAALKDSSEDGLKAVIRAALEALKTFFGIQ